jgi:hypothetical protein
LQSKFTKSANKSKKKFLIKKFNMGIKKGEFHADFESAEKVSELKITKNRQKGAVENNRMAVNGFRLPNSSFFPPSCL